MAEVETPYYYLPRRSVSLSFSLLFFLARGTRTYASVPFGVTREHEVNGRRGSAAVGFSSFLDPRGGFLLSR